MTGFQIKRFNTKRAIISVGVLISIYVFLLFLLIKVEQEAPNRKLVHGQDAVWYLLQTLTTVGYGDVLPVTYWGRMIGFVFLISSLGVYGFIIGQIANFMNTIQESKMLGFSGTDFKNHVVMIGWNDFGQSVISHLIGAGRQVAVITKERANVDIIREYYNENQVYTLYSDYNNFDLIEKSNIKNSSIIFINLSDDTEKLVYVINIKKRFPNLNYVVTLDNGNLKGTFQAAGAMYTISKNEISSKLLASYIYEPDVALFSEELIAYAHEEHEYDMKQIQVREDNPFKGVFYEKVFFDLKKSSNVVLIGLVKMENGVRKMLKNPEGSVKIEQGDYLILLMDGAGEARLRKLFHLKEGLQN
ncbi:MAG: potassium channel family protein [Cyclobacteriaceae bacterium]|jgi:voltage-gated potassium channel|nr:potassium channel family protein [Flammeovirgaceae bacterium]